MHSSATYGPMGIAVGNETCMLLTGAPSVGKTTAIRHVAEKLPSVRLGGLRE